MPEYPKLKPCRVVEHTPSWRDAEAAAGQKRRELAEAEAAAKTPAAELHTEPTIPKRKNIPHAAQGCPEQQSFFDTAGQPYTTDEESPGSEPVNEAPGGDTTRKEDMPYDPGDGDALAAFHQSLIAHQKLSDMD